MKFVVLLFARRQEKEAVIAELITQGLEAGLARLLTANKIIAAANYNLQVTGLEPLNGYAGKSFSDLCAPVTLLWLVFGLVGWLVAGENFDNKT